MSGVSVRLEVMRKWYEVCSGVTDVLSVVVSGKNVPFTFLSFPLLACTYLNND